ncbi:hypothetical protein llg_24430 [Luteolibacter sp. LG18]|nr:hypothetical protein llg_24430 [Luteolibacter sp. LG18]
MAAPGAGLPAVEGWLARHVIFPRFVRKTTTAEAVDRFVADGRWIVERVRALEPERQRTRVRIERLRGMEDSSREWSPLMVVEHLLITGPAMLGAARSLSAGVVPGRAVSTAAVKPKGEAGAELLEEFGRLLDGYPAAVAALTFPTKPKFPHPWFGPLDARRWVVLNAFHQALHRRQLERIVAAK